MSEIGTLRNITAGAQELSSSVQAKFYSIRVVRPCRSYGFLHNKWKDN